MPFTEPAKSSTWEETKGKHWVGWPYQEPIPASDEHFPILLPTPEPPGGAGLQGPRRRPGMQHRVPMGWAFARAALVVAHHATLADARFHCSAARGWASPAAWNSRGTY